MGIVGALPQALTGAKNGLHHHHGVSPGAAHSVRWRLMEERRWWLLNALFALFVACALFGPSKAHASGTVAPTVPAGTTTPGYYWCPGGGSTPSCATRTEGSSVGAVAAASVGKNFGSSGTAAYNIASIQWSDAGSQTFRFNTAGAGAFTVGVTAFTMTLPMQCPSNSVAVGTSCQCGAGYVPNAGATACQGICAATTGQPMGSGEVTALVSGKGVVPVSMCNEGCKYTMNGSGQGGWGALNGVYTYWGQASDWTGTGASCTNNPAVPGGGTPTDPPGTPMPPASAPPKGMCPGTVNGVAVNVPCGDAGTNSGGAASPPPPGASGGAASPASPNAPGPGSFSPSAPTPAPANAKPGDKGSSGTCEGDRCATTECVVVLKPDLSMEKQCGTTYEDKGTFCKNNPGDPKCKAEQSSFVGTCEAPVACTGDAVQCQVAKQQLADSCDARKVSEATGAIYTGLKGTGVSITGLDSSINIGNMLPAGPAQSCALSDTSFALMEGFSVSMPLGTLLCDKLGVIRAVIGAFGFVMWSIIVFGLRGN